MKKNLYHITMMLILSLSYQSQTLTVSSYFSDREIRKLKEDELTRQADAEIEDFLINSEILEPTFENPALWKVLIRQYGIQVLCSCFNFKTWLVQKYHTIKDVLYENPDQNEKS